VPLVHHGRVLGVLNLHHSSEPDAFSDDDLEFAERLGRLDAEIIARAQEHEQLRSQAARYEAVREAQRALGGRAPILERLGALCQVVARRAEDGISTIYLYDEGEQELRLAATSLPGGGFGGDYRVVMGQGVDGGAAKSRQPAFLYAPDRSLAYGALPMLSGSNLVGVLSVQAGRKPTGPGARDTRVLEETLQEIAACTADEVAQADREARMSSRATKVSAINEAGIRLMSARDPDEAARLATSSAALILEADHVVMRLQDPDTRRYVIRSYYGSGDGRFEERLFLLDKQACVEAIRRRSAFLLRDPATRPGFEGVESEVRSLLAAPLKREGKVVGTLALYDKVAADQFYPGSFDDEDLAVFMKYVSYVERALEAAAIYQRASQQRNFDEQTGLPNADYLDRRIDQEIARAGGREGSLAVVSCLVENLDEIRRAAGPRGTDRVVERTAASLRAHLRDFDVLGRTGDGEFIALLPDPGPAPDERVAQLARGIADDIAKDDALNDPVRVALAFGYAIHPSDGPARPALLEQAREPRIRMV